MSGISEGGQALLMIAKIPSTIRNYKKTPEITCTLSSSGFWRRELVLRVKWISLVWNWGKFWESLPHWYHLHFPKVIILNGPYANYTTKPRLWTIFYSLTLCVHEYSFQPFYSRKPWQTCTKLVGLVVWNLLRAICVIYRDRIPEPKIQVNHLIRCAT